MLEPVAPSYFILVFPNFTELESLVQLGQPVGQYMLPMVVLGHGINNGIHCCVATLNQ